jgi:predicted transcriptional regulator of viral defense system
MRATEALTQLRALGRPVLETGEAVARLSMSSNATANVLSRLEQAGHVRRLGRGLWLLDDVDPSVVVPYLTRPFPAYVSLWSALSHHGMIQQIPRQVFAVSLDRPRTIETPLGVYSIHHLAPEVFGGYNGTDTSGFWADKEKAVFDTVYLQAAQRRQVHMPELEFTADFDQTVLGKWTSQIRASWLRSKVARELERLMQNSTNAAI